MIKLFLVLLTGLYSYIALANPNPDLLKKYKDDSKYAGSNLLMLYDSTTAEVKESGLSYYYFHRLYKVLNRKGALTLSVIKQGYDPLTAYTDILKVTVYAKDGSTREIDVKKTTDYAAPARSIYWGAREKMLEVGRLNPGDALEVLIYKKGFSYALLQNDDQDYIPPMYGSFYDIVPFWSDDPANIYCLSKVYKVKFPESKNVYYKFYYGAAKTEIFKRNKEQIYIFSQTDIAPFKKEPMMVSLYDVAPKLLISTTKSWSEKSKWFYGVNEDFGSFIADEKIKSMTKKILRTAKTEMDSVSLLTHWAADEIRYSGLNMGKGEGFTLHKGTMTFLDRCGVCKDKAGMLITMLRAAGFETYAAMTMAGSKIDEIPADHFNHCVVAVRLKDGKLHPLDPTWVPFRRELWSSAEQQQNYLVGTKSGEKLAITPVSPAENHYIKLTANNELAADGTLKGELVVEAEGQSDAAVRSLFTSYFKTQWFYNAEKEFTDLYPAAVIENIDYKEPYNYLEAPVKITYKYTIKDFAVNTGKTLIFQPIIFTQLFKRGQNQFNYDTTLTERKYAFRDRCSRLVELKENIKLPAGYKAVYLPKNNDFKAAAASFSSSSSVNNNTVSFTSNIRLEKRVYEKEDWTDYRKVVALQLNNLKEKIIISK